MNTHKLKRQRNSDTKTGNGEPQHNYRLRTVRNEFLGGGGGAETSFTVPTSPVQWYKTFSWLFGSHDNPLTLQ